MIERLKKVNINIFRQKKIIILKNIILDIYLQ